MLEGISGEDRLSGTVPEATVCSAIVAARPGKGKGTGEGEEEEDAPAGGGDGDIDQVRFQTITNVAA